MNITLEQWQALIAVVDQGGYAQGAESLRKSQSTLSYAIQKIEDQLGVTLFRMEGRKAKLTDTGEVLVRHARDLLNRAALTEELAIQYGEGAEPLIRLQVEAIFPESAIFEALREFSQAQPQTRIELRQSVLSGTEEAILQRRADLVIGGRVPPGYTGEPLTTIEFIAVAAPDHTLVQSGNQLGLEDLRSYRQIVVKDSGQRNLDDGWLGAYQRWSVDSIELSIKAVIEGLGFAWLPELKVQDHIDSGRLVELPLIEGARRNAQLHLILTNGEYTSAGVIELGKLIKQVVAQQCPHQR